MHTAAARAQRARSRLAEARRNYKKTPRGRYQRHKENAKRRGVAFLFTFEEWLEVWQTSGKWDERGNRAGGYVMCRKGDEGPYADGNVYIGLHAANVAERNTLYARKRHTAKTTTVTFHPPDIEANHSIYGAVTAPF